MKKICAVLLAVLLASVTSACSLGRKKAPPLSDASSSSRSSSEEENGGTQPEQEESVSPAPEKAEENSPEEAARLALGAFKNLDMEKMALYIDGMSAAAELHEDTKKAAELLVSQLSCTFGQAVIDGDSATIPVSITNRDYSGVITALLPSATILFAKNPHMTAQEAQEAFSGKLAEQLDKTDGKTVTRDVTLSLKRKADGWKVVLDETVADALCGGMLGGLKEMTDKLGVRIPGFSKTSAQD